MKKIKKITAMLFGLTCILALGILAHAADDGKVLVEYHIDPDYADTCELYMGGPKGGVFTRELNSGGRLTGFGVWACEKGNPKNNSRKVEMSLLNTVSGLTDRGVENIYPAGEIISTFDGTDAKVSTANGFMFTKFYADTTPVILINVRPEITLTPPAEPTPTPEEPQPTPNPGKPVTRLTLTNAYIFGNGNGDSKSTDMDAARPVTREELCALIGRILRQNGYYEGFDPKAVFQFSDCNSWAYKHLMYAADKGAFDIRKSSPDLNIYPNQPVNRGEAAHIIACMLNLQEEADLSGFTDITTDDPYASGIAKVAAAGLMQGDNNNRFNPDLPIIRAEIVTVINRLIGRDSDFYKLVTKDGELSTAYYCFPDLEAQGAAGAWYYEDMIRAASAYDAEGYIDPAARTTREALDD